jgi:hypothetical protein
LASNRWLAEFTYWQGIPLSLEEMHSPAICYKKNREVGPGAVKSARLYTQADHKRMLVSRTTASQQV